LLRGLRKIGTVPGRFVTCSQSICRYRGLARSGTVRRSIGRRWFGWIGLRKSGDGRGSRAKVRDLLTLPGPRLSSLSPRPSRILATDQPSTSGGQLQQVFLGHLESAQMPAHALSPSMGQRNHRPVNGHDTVSGGHSTRLRSLSNHNFASADYAIKPISHACVLMKLPRQLRNSFKRK
jgi:hypothetical protein